MAKIISSFLILSLVFLQVFGQGWINNPIPRGYLGDNTGSASETPPCGREGTYNVTTTVVQSTTLAVTFELSNNQDNNANSPLVCRFAIADTDTSATAFNEGVVASGITCRNDANSGTVSVPIETSPGIKYLQFYWAADNNWYSCIKLNVTPGSIVTTNLENNNLNTVEVEENNSTSSNRVYLNIPLGYVDDGQYKHLLLKYNQTMGDGAMGNVNLTAATNTRPYTYNTGNTYGMVRNYVQTLSVCNLVAGEQTAYVTLFPTYDYFGNVSIQSRIYEAQLDFNTRTEIVIDTLQDESFMFWTEAYSEADSRRRIVIIGRGSDGYFSGPYTSCNVQSRDQLNIPIDPNYCVDIPLRPVNNQQNTKRYYHVLFNGEYHGKVLLQRGPCSEFSSAPSIIISMILLAVVLFF